MIGALAAGVSLVVQTAGVIKSNRVAIHEWIHDAVAADLIVTSRDAPSPPPGTTSPMAASISSSVSGNLSRRR